MKALSLWQPWASAMFLFDRDRKRIKPDETRHWSVDYRGRIAIHAAKKDPVPGLDYDPELDAILRALIHKTTRDLPHGYLLGYGDLVAVEPTFKVRPMRSPSQTLWGDYRNVGDDGKKRYAWTFENMVELPWPVPWRGARGLFEVPDSVFDVLKPRRGDD